MPISIKDNKFKRTLNEGEDVCQFIIAVSMSGSFDGKTTNGWASPQKKMTRIKALYEFFHAANIDAPTYKIIETGCDRCAEIAHQILREEFEKLDPGQ